MCVCVCVCTRARVCVYVRKREKDFGIKTKVPLIYFFSLMIITSLFLERLSMQNRLNGAEQVMTPKYKTRI